MPELVDEVQRALADSPAGSHRAATNSGLLEGLTMQGRAPVRWPLDLPMDDTSPEQARRGGVLAGHLVVSLLADGATLSDLCAPSTYAAALASPQAQASLAERTGAGLLKAHSFACALLARRVTELTEDQEVRYFRWLVSSYARVPLAGLEERMLTWRERRIEKLASRAAR